MPGEFQAGLECVLRGVEVEDYDIAIGWGREGVRSISIRLEQDLEVLTKGRRKKGVQRTVFRVQSNSGHWLVIFPLAVMLANVKSYPLVVDTRFDAPTVDMMKDLQDGVIDVGILWGPIAGNFAKDAKPALQVTPLVSETTGPKMVYRMGLGVRHSDQEWKRTLNRLIAENQGEIDKILASYGVPLLDDNDKPKAN